MIACVASGEPARRPVTAADEVVTALYRTQYRSLVRMALFLVGDVQTAEDVVQDCFVGMHAAFWRLHDHDKALHYLRRSVMNRSRSALRRRTVAARHEPQPGPDMPSAEHGAMTRLDRATLAGALRELPARQREAIVLRFYLDLSEAQTAAVMGVTIGAVKSHTARAKAALRSLLGEWHGRQ